MPAYDPHRLLQQLDAHGVAFVVIGQAAAVLQGVPSSATLDLDITIEVSVDNAERLVEALLSIEGGRIDNAQSLGERLPPEEVELLGHQPTRFATMYGVLDVVPFVRGVGDYARVRERALTVDLDGLQVMVAALEDVIASKEALGRPKDRAHLPALRATLRARDRDAEQGRLE